MNTSGVRIEYIKQGLPFAESDEYIVIFNGSTARFDLSGWRLVYEDLSSRKILHTHQFYPLDGSFDPAERLCVISSVGEDRFQPEGIEPDFPGTHWDLHTDNDLHLLDRSHVRVRLINEAGAVVDSLSLECSRGTASIEDAITIFVGHGHDQQWRDLKDHLRDQHNFSVAAYEIGARAGHSVKEVLEGMLRESSFALLVLTADDLHVSGEVHARENVVHELGLFQGKLGFARAIALLEEGVNEFSNIRGVNQIRYAKGRIRETFGDVVATIKREFPLVR